MCGSETCGKIGGKIACISHMLGALALILTAVTRLTTFSPMGLGPRSFAALAVLLYLNGIASAVCPMCGGACCSDKGCESKEGKS